MKNQEIRELTNEELKEKLAEMQSSLEKMKLNHAITTLENPMTIRTARRSVARINTELNKRLKAENTK